MDYTNIIISPIISERSMDDVSKTKFTFKVNLPSKSVTVPDDVPTTIKLAPGIGCPLSSTTDPVIVVWE